MLHIFSEYWNKRDLDNCSIKKFCGTFWKSARFIFIMHTQYTYKYIQIVLKSVSFMYFKAVRICFCLLKGSWIKSNPKVTSK